ncbi:MAG: M15 family metallopeptidase [Chthoniobacterales bacterium]
MKKRLFILSCLYPCLVFAQTKQEEKTVYLKDAAAVVSASSSVIPVEHHFVDLLSLPIPPLLEIRYATKYNFTGVQLYPFPRAYLHQDAAAALLAVQKDLAARGLGLKVYDAYRPLSVQRTMWNLIRDERYVSNPDVSRGRHTRGAAVDVTLVDKLGNELPMPSPFDEFTETAHRNYTGAKPEQKKNSLLLEEVMKKYGFDPFPYEWWHFDFRNWQNYPPLDISIQELSEGKRLTMPVP